MRWIALLVALAAAPLFADTDRRDKPNIIYIMLDDAGCNDFAAAGSPHIQTPTFDRLAREGTRFTDHYSGSAVCAPTRCVLMTGLHTGHCRRRDNQARGNRDEADENGRLVFLRPEDVTIAEVLQHAGYATGGIGKWGLGNPGSTGQPEKQGFDSWFGYLDQAHAHDHYAAMVWDGGTMIDLPGNANGAKGEYVPYLQEQKTLEFVRRHKDRPFFLYLAYTPPHSDYVIPADDPGLALYRDKPWPAQVQNYAAMITQVDRSVGKLLDELDTLGIADNTIVFYTSDNGPNAPFVEPLQSNGPHRGIKRNLYEGGIRAAMAVRWPGHVPAGRVSDFVWDMCDFFPTACAIAGAQTPDDLDGTSVLPTLLGEAQDPRDHHYWEIHFPVFHQAVRLGRYKAIRFGTAAPIAIYDLPLDPGERTNIAADHPALVEQMKRIMDTSRTPTPFWPAIEHDSRKKGNRGP